MGRRKKKNIFGASRGSLILNLHFYFPASLQWHFAKPYHTIPCVSPNGVLSLFDTGSIPFSIIIEISELLMPQQLGAGKMWTAKMIMTTFETWGQRALPVTAQAPVSLLLRQHSQCIIFLATLRCEHVISKSYPRGGYWIVRPHLLRAQAPLTNLD